VSLKPFYVSAAVSVCCGVLVFFLFGLFAPSSRDQQTGNGYVVLAVDESRNDRRIRESLASLGLGGIISESGQEILMDDFGSLKMIPLDIFRDEIETFDPRDDGYAAKLSAFFVQGGNRLIFIPMDKNSGMRIGKLKKQLAHLFGAMQFSLSLLGKEGYSFPGFVLLAAACAGALFFSRSRRLFIFQLPVLLAFHGIGFSSFILAALFTGIWELLREPLRELSAVRYHNRPFDYAGKGINGMLNRLMPYSLNLILVLVFIVLLALICIGAELPPVPLAPACLSFILVHKLAFWTEAWRMRNNRHAPFTPVLILPLRVRTFSLFPLLLPFGAVYILALLLPLFPPGFKNSGEGNTLIDPGSFISLEDYGRHINFQNSFSYRPVGRTPGLGLLGEEEYLRYYLGEDGLIGGSTDNSGVEEINIPSFPLEKLMYFLVDYYKPGTGGVRNPLPGSSLLNIKEWISVGMIFIGCFLDLLQGGSRSKKRKKIPVFGDRRIAA